MKLNHTLLLALAILLCSRVYSGNFIENKFPSNVIATLYSIDEISDIHAIESWNNFLYVGQSLNDQYTLDIWDLSDIKSPELKQSLDFGVAKNSYIPFAPLSIIPLNNKLLVQTADGFWFYKQQMDGALEFIKKDTLQLSSPNDLLSKVNISGKWGSMTTFSVDNLGNGIFTDRLINFTDPFDPKPVFGNYGKLNNTINATLDGSPASLIIDRELNTISLKRLTPVDFEEHIDAFWKQKIQSTLDADLSVNNVPDFMTEIIAQTNIDDIMGRAVELLAQELNFGNYSIQDWIYQFQAPEEDLYQLMLHYNIRTEDAFATMIRAFVSESFDQQLNRELSEIIYKETFSLFHEAIMKNLGINDNIQESYEKAYELFSETFTEENLINYLTDELLGPLIGDFDFMHKSLDKVLNEISSTDAAEYVSDVLTLSNYMINPLEAFEFFDTWGESIPTCFNWPENIDEVFQLVLFENPAGIEREQLAWYQLFKYYIYVKGGDFGEVQSYISETVEEINNNLAVAYVNKLSEAVSVFSEQVNSIDAAIEAYISTIPAQGILEDAVTLTLCYEFEKIGISADMKIEDLLEYTNINQTFDANLLVYLPACSLGDLVDAMNGLEYLSPVSANTTSLMKSDFTFSTSNNDVLSTPLTTVFDNAAINTEILEEHLTKVLAEFSLESFGSIFQHESIESSVISSVFTQMDLGSLMTNQLGTIFGNMVSTHGEAVPFTNFIFDAVKAFEGDCLRQWTTTLKAIEIALSWVPGATPYAAILDAALQEAADYAIKKLASEMLNLIVGQIFSDADNSWPSWSARFEETEVFSQPILPENGDYENFLDAGVWNNKIARVYYNRTTDFTNRKVATLEVTDLLSGTTESFALGTWNNLDFMYTDGDLLYLSGSLYENNKGERAKANAIIFDYQEDDLYYQYVYRSDFTGSQLTAAQGFEVTGNGQYMVVQGVNQLMILPNTFGLMNETRVNTTAIRATSSNNLSVYPNPTSDYLQIEGVTTQSNIKIMSANGQLIENIQISNENTVIDVKHLPKGSYIVELNHQNRIKFIKQ